MTEQRITTFEALTPVVRKQIGQRIRAAREEQGKSQVELAEQLGTRQAYISELETGKSEPGATMLILLGHALDKPTAYFFPPEYRDMSSQPELRLEALTLEEQALIAQLRQLETGFNHALGLHLLQSMIQFAEMH